MSPVLTQRVAGTSSGVSRAVLNCQSQMHCSGVSVASSSRTTPISSGSSPAGIRRAVEQVVGPMLSPSADIANASLEDINAAGVVPPSPSTAAVNPQLQPQVDWTVPAASAATFTSTGSSPNRPSVPQQMPSSEDIRPTGLVAPRAQDRTTVAVTCASVSASASSDTAPLREDSGLLESASDIAQNVLATTTTFIPLMRAPPSPTQSSAPCSPASSVLLSSGAYRSSVASAYRFTSSGIDSCPGACAFASNTSLLAPTSVPAAVADGNCPLVNALLGPSETFRQCFSEFASPPSIQRRAPAIELPNAPVAAISATAPVMAERLSRLANLVKDPADVDPHAAAMQRAAEPDIDLAVPGQLATADAVAEAVLPPLSYLTAASLSGCSSRRSSLRDQNSVTIKATTVVKDAAGAIDKILSRGVTALVTALRSGGPPYTAPYDSLNQAVKAIAVARQYAKETGPPGAEVTFLPFHRYDSNERPDPFRFAFLVFPVPHLNERLKTADETVLNVARGSDVHKMASAIIAVMLDRGQAVMKAAGSEAIFVAMSAVVNARHRLIAKHGFDLMLAAAWITEDTVSTMGRESKFLRFNVLKTEPAGPKSRVAPTLPALAEAC
ncbi:hypothetical protein Vretifemale_12357 [Volvox reticuliferus]|uniref:Uncharacterized protein n=1 Tax=Volvox reticuliferus TaxID=1737510 RepID=A0A8J4CNQ7_9CHLO|nr:hypothetical protein Vretifemale_12357 [Volvox reticuliferus]